jgi:hypothetical protein
MKTLGILTGKQKEYNTKVLTLLYDNGPLSAWELSAKIRKVGRQSLHATLNRRLRLLEKKGYVRREDRKWYLQFKGIIAALVIQEKPVIWNPKWKEIFANKAKAIEQNSAPFLDKFGIEKKDIHEALRNLGLCLDDFNAWVGLSKKVKTLMENGVINFDIIKQETLLGIIIMETMTTEELSNIWESSPRDNSVENGKTSSET